MSHVASVNLQVKDLDSLKKACAGLGLTFKEGQRTFKWYGRWVNDYSADDAAYRNGIAVEDYGKCLHAIAAPGAGYEVGVVQNPNGPGFILIYDNWQEGKGLEKHIGKDAVKIKQAYAAQVTKKELRKLGMRVQEVKTPSGQIKLIGRR